MHRNVISFVLLDGSTCLLCNCCRLLLLIAIHLIISPLLAEGISWGNELASADGGRLYLAFCVLRGALYVSSLKLHFFVFAEGNLALIVDDLLMRCEGLICFSQVINIVLIKLINQLIHDILWLGFIDLLRTFLAVQSRRLFTLVEIGGSLRVYKAVQGLFIALL